jgi:putative ABC transport system permease protein
MLKNYFLTAIRNLRRNKLFSAINVFGLAIGISASLVIYLIVHYNFSFDKFEKDGDRIYRVVSDYDEQGVPGTTRGTQGPLGEAVKKLTGLQDVVTFRYFNFDKLAVPAITNMKPAMFKYPQRIIFADKHYFDLLHYQWLAGSPSVALHDMNKVVLTESRARTYFPHSHRS